MKRLHTLVVGIPEPTAAEQVEGQAHRDREALVHALFQHPWLVSLAEGDLLHQPRAASAPPAADRVQRPAHYTQHPSGIEAITITRWMNFNLGNAMKYLFRAGHKDPDPREDLRKAIRYIEFELENLEQQHGPATGGAPSA